jgi:hypothetical protein
MERFDGLVRDASAWTGADLHRDQSWILQVTPDMAREIRAAIDAVRHLPIDRIERGMFRLPAWKAVFDHIDRELEDGRGFVLMRGMPLDGLEMDDIKRLYWGFGIQLGEPVSQNKFGNLIDLVEYYKNNPAGLICSLKHPVKKSILDIKPTSSTEKPTRRVTI